MPKHLIQPRWVHHNGKWTWRVLVPKALQEEGRPKRRYFGTDKGEALAFAADLEKERRSGAMRFTSLTREVQVAVMHALEILGEGRGHEISDAVRYYMAHNVKEQRTVKQAVAECIADKEAANLRRRYTVALKSTLTRFSEGREETLVHEISSKELKMWINASFQDDNGEWQTPATDTRRARKIDLGTFFNYCFKHGWIQKNPMDAIEKIKRDKKTPAFLTVDQCKAIMKVATEYRGGDLLATVALQLFGGLRPDESYKITWDDVKGDVIKLDGTKTKVRDIRNVDITPALRSWLEHARKLNENSTYPKKGLPGCDAQKQMARIHDVARPWVKDYTRHTFVTYGMEQFNWDWVVKNAGHSLAMSFAHYRGLTTRQTAEEFWEILPSNL